MVECPPKPSDCDMSTLGSAIRASFKSTETGFCHDNQLCFKIYCSYVIAAALAVAVDAQFGSLRLHSHASAV